MQLSSYIFGTSKVQYIFDGNFRYLKNLCHTETTVIITDEHVYEIHTAKFKGWNTIVIKPGEPYKNQSTVDAVIAQLVERGVDRSYTLVGIGGGVITDLTGYVASIYMRGIRFGFIPTTILALVDASIGGKNGVDVGVYKNMVGIIRQPSFLLHDLSLLKSLPEAEWINGFAEIIKHACIKDTSLFKELSEKNLAYYQKHKKALAALIKKNVLIKTKVVQKDEFEKGDRKLLNYGHTLGHAIENMYQLSHGQAISIGMTYAAALSELLIGFKQKSKVTQILSQYGLSTYATFDLKKAINILIKDKKKKGNEIHYILLQKIGKGVIHSIPLNKIETLLEKVIKQYS
jgi:3-dehydroquinate synthase